MVKHYDAPVLLAPTIQAQQASAPPTPAAGYATGVYFKTDDLPYYKTDDGTEIPVEVLDAATNLITNGDFETGNPPSTWIAFWGSGTKTFGADTTNRLFGSQCGSITLGVSSSLIVESSKVTVGPGDMIEVGFWAKMLTSTGTPALSSALYTAPYATGPAFFDNVSFTSETENLPVTTSWKYFRRSYIVPNTHIRAEAFFRFTTDASSTGTVLLDNVTVRKIANGNTGLDLAKTQHWDKQPVDAATASDVTLAGGAPQVVDGVTLVAGLRVLVRAEATPAQNGIYLVTTPGTGANGTWTRAIDADTSVKLAGAMVSVLGGATYGGTQWSTSFKSSDTLGTTTVTWTQLGVSGGGGAAPVWLKDACLVATTADVTLTGGAPSTVDGVALALNSRVLVRTNTAPAQNGIYTVAVVGTGANGTWNRATDADSSIELAGAQVAVQSGTLGGSQWSTSFKSTDTLGTTTMPWNQIGGTANAAGYRANAIQSIPNAVVTTVNLPATDHQVGGNFSIASNIVTVGADGVYELSGMGTFDSTGSAGRRLLMIETWVGADPGVGVATQLGRQELTNALGSLTVHSIADQAYLTAGAKIRLLIYQSSGAAMNTALSPASRLNIKAVTQAVPAPVTDVYRKIDLAADFAVSNTTALVMGTMTTTVTSPGPTATFVVTGTYSVETVSAVGYITCYVDGAQQPGVLVTNLNGRLNTSYTWMVTGLAAGSHTIAFYGNSGAAGQTLNVRAGSSSLEVRGAGGVTLVPDTGWIAFPFTPPWANYGSGWDPAMYRRKDGIVYLKGLIVGGSIGSTIGNLPAGFRPAGDQHIATAGQGVYALINIFASGRVASNAGTGGWITLQVPPFPADN